MFLHHPLVPDSVKQSQSHTINIKDIIKKQRLEEDDVKNLLKELKEFNAYSLIRLSNLHSLTILDGSPIYNRFSSI